MRVIRAALSGNRSPDAICATLMDPIAELFRRNAAMLTKTRLQETQAAAPAAIPRLPEEGRPGQIGNGHHPTERDRARSHGASDARSTMIMKRRLWSAPLLR